MSFATPLRNKLRYFGAKIQIAVLKFEFAPKSLRYGSVRFGSRNFINGSVRFRFQKFFGGSVRFGSRKFSDGSVRFRFQKVFWRFGSVPRNQEPCTPLVQTSTRSFKTRTCAIARGTVAKGHHRLNCAQVVKWTQGSLRPALIMCVCSKNS